jgi:hypothetical protein
MTAFLISPLRIPPDHPKADVRLRDPNVRFGSKADICAAKTYVRFTPNSDRESGFPQKVISALPPKADMCEALADVCLGPIADIAATYSISSSARPSSDGVTLRANAFAVLRFMINSTLLTC